MSVFSFRQDLNDYSPPPPYDDFWYTDPSSGYTVGSSPTGAMRIAAVYRCVSILSGIVAYLPAETNEKLSDGGRKPRTDLPIYSVLKKRTNRRQTSNAWRRYFMSQVLLQGNSYNQIIRRGRAGDVEEIVPLDSTRMNVDLIKESGRLKYTYTDANGEKKNIAPENLLHFMGPSLNGITGLSPISYCRETVRLTMEAERSATAFYKNNAAPVGVLSHPMKLTKEIHERIRESWRNTYGGSSNAGKVAILEEGTTYTPVTMSARDSQYIEIRKFQIAEIARMYGVPLPLLGDLDNAHFNNVENLFQIFLTVTLTDILTMIEQEIDSKLFTGTELYFKFNTRGLLRGDIERRTRAMESMARNGVINPDEWREIEDMNPRGDDDGKLYQRPMNMIYEPFADAEEINQTTQGTEEPKKEEPAAEDEEDKPKPKPAAKPKRSIPVSSFRSIFADALERIFTKESKRLEAALRKLPDERDEYLRSWYAKHDETIRDTLRPVVRGYLDFLRAMDHDVEDNAAEKFLSDFSSRCVRASLSDIDKARGDVRELQELSIAFFRSRPADWSGPALTLVNSMVNLPYESEN